MAAVITVKSLILRFKKLDYGIDFSLGPGAAAPGLLPTMQKIAPPRPQLASNGNSLAPENKAQSQAATI
jgi:hypothetical protein